jgi:hypothetical protein
MCRSLIPEHPMAARFTFRAIDVLVVALIFTALT